MKKSQDTNLIPTLVKEIADESSAVQADAIEEAAPAEETSAIQTADAAEEVQAESTAERTEETEVDADEAETDEQAAEGSVFEIVSQEEEKVDFSPKYAVDNIPAFDEKLLARKMKKMTSKRQRRKQAKRLRILNLTEEKDIRYRGFLSYRGLRILAWFFFLASQVGVLVSFAGRMDAAFAEKMHVWIQILPLSGNYIAPLFLLAAFATILNNSRKFSSLLRLYGGFAIIVFLLFCLLHDRYLVGIVMKALSMSRADATALLDGLIGVLSQNGYICFNIFIDLFLCTLFTFFVVYRPRKYFVGKKLIVFRAFAAFPIAYELASIAVKAMSSLGVFVLPTYVYPLLTTKPPMTFLVFIALTFFIKRREWLYRRNGKTHEQYQKFLGTKLNSLQFSSFVTIQFVVVAILDLILHFILSSAIQSHFAMAEDPAREAMATVSAWGFGDCVSLLGVVPIIMLFSYTRKHKNTHMDLIINILGVIAVILIYIEGLYQGILYELDAVKALLLSA